MFDRRQGRTYKQTTAMLDAVRTLRLVFVTGKGGVGKTAVAAALATAAARSGRRTLLVEVDPFGRLGEYLGGLTPAPEPAELSPTLAVAAIAPDVIMEEFLVGMLRIRALARRLLASHTFRVVSAAAPGLEDFLTLVRVAGWESARVGLRGRRPRWDLVVVDAPATGHSVPLLATPNTLLKMLPFGPLASSARDLALLLRDPDRTAALVVTRPEEMVVNETIELATALMRTGIALLPPIVNALAPLRLTREDARRLRSEPPDVPGSFLPYLPAGRFALARQRAADRQIRRLGRALDTRPLGLPQVPAARFGRIAVEQLADELVAIGPAMRVRYAS